MILKYIQIKDLSQAHWSFQVKESESSYVPAYQGPQNPKYHPMKCLHLGVS